MMLAGNDLVMYVFLNAILLLGDVITQTMYLYSDLAPILIFSTDFVFPELLVCMQTVHFLYSG